MRNEWPFVCGKKKQTGVLSDPKEHFGNIQRGSNKYLYTGSRTTPVASATSFTKLSSSEVFIA
jgi:hypothetical protein